MEGIIFSIVIFGAALIVWAIMNIYQHGPSWPTTIVLAVPVLLGLTASIASACAKEAQEARRKHEAAQRKQARRKR
jgi:hypothetical protein